MGFNSKYLDNLKVAITRHYNRGREYHNKKRLLIKEFNKVYQNVKKKLKKSQLGGDFLSISNQINNNKIFYEYKKYLTNFNLFLKKSYLTKKFSKKELDFLWICSKGVTNIQVNEFKQDVIVKLFTSFENELLFLEISIKLLNRIKTTITQELIHIRNRHSYNEINGIIYFINLIEPLVLRLYDYVKHEREFLIGKDYERLDNYLIEESDIILHLAEELGKIGITRREFLKKSAKIGLTASVLFILWNRLDNLSANEEEPKAEGKLVRIEQCPNEIHWDINLPIYKIEKSGIIIKFYESNQIKRGTESFKLIQNRLNEIFTFTYEINELIKGVRTIKEIVIQTRYAYLTDHGTKWVVMEENDTANAQFENYFPNRLTIYDELLFKVNSETLLDVMYHESFHLLEYALGKQNSTLTMSDIYKFRDWRIRYAFDDLKIVNPEMLMFSESAYRLYGGHAQENRFEFFASLNSIVRIINNKGVLALQTAQWRLDANFLLQLGYALQSLYTSMHKRPIPIWNEQILKAFGIVRQTLLNYLMWVDLFEQRDYETSLDYFLKNTRVYKNANNITNWYLETSPFRINIGIYAKFIYYVLGEKYDLILRKYLGSLVEPNKVIRGKKVEEFVKEIKITIERK